MLAPVLSPLRPTVLIVEDDPRVQETLARLFEPVAAPIAAQTMFQARQVLRQQRVDVVLLDLGLPDGLGTELLEELTPAIEAGRLEVLIFSALLDVSRAGECARAGALASLDKGSTDNHALLAHLQAALEHRAARLGRLGAATSAEADELMAELRGSANPAGRAAARVVEEQVATGRPLLLCASGRTPRLLARWLHERAGGLWQPFITYDVESRRADRDLSTCVMAARGGTLLVDGFDDADGAERQRIVRSLTPPP